MKVGVYVGSFNPVHKGHIKIVRHLLKYFLDKVIVVATQNYWDKKNLINLNDRINMLKKYESDKIIIDTDCNNYEYTYMVMSKLKEEYDDLYLIIGADNIIAFNKWKNFSELLKYKLVIINRDNIDVYKYLKLYGITNYIVVNNLSNIDISSTYIRENINNKKLLVDKIDKEIYDYIVYNKLYEVIK